MKLSNFDFVFCDLDGTILEDKMRHYMCYKDIVYQYGGTPINMDEYWNDKRNNVKLSVILEKSDFKERYKIYSNEWLQRIEQERYLKYEVLKPNIKRTIKYIKKSVKQFNLVTMRSNKYNLMKQLEYLQIREYFDSIYVGSSSLGYRKCDLVDSFYGKRALVIGDTEDDMEFANKIGSFF